ncbi:hypothetical protein GQ457_07G003590 [Hibiscus cannabinus]
MIVEDLTRESNKIPPTRADVYVNSRTRKYGSIVNSKVAVIVERIQEKINKSSSSENLSQISCQMMCSFNLKDRKEEGVSVV